METATFGAGCFWCVEAIFQGINGVCGVQSGYTGGHTIHPNYTIVCSGDSGHVEVCQIQFDEQERSYSELLDVFWHIHDPTTPNRQGNDIGSQYRSAVFYHNKAQKELALLCKNQLEASKTFTRPIVTSIEKLDQFYPAENYHQKYYRQNPRQPYCLLTIEPKLRKFRDAFHAQLKDPQFT